jgi:acetate kinase
METTKTVGQADRPQKKILVINAGSSSLKFELFEMPSERGLASGLLERIGEPESRLAFRRASGAPSGTVVGDAKDKTVTARPVADHAEGLRWILAALTEGAGAPVADTAEIAAVGHRVVHGGEAFTESVVITDEVERAVEANSDLAPLHNPPNLLGIRVAKSVMPDVPQVAVFDTAFHQTLPPHAFLYAIPYECYKEGRIRRYGFHGTSHRYVAARAAELLGRPAADVNLITCHLGNGASIAAVAGGRSVDTSMGLTPLEGVVMGTRSGDLDPALPLFLQRQRGLTAEEVDHILNKKSGLLGLSGRSNDLRVIEAAAAEGDERATLALDVYCYRIRKYVGAYTAALGHVDALVFTAGVGENSDVVRGKVLDGLAPLGFALDPAKNHGLRGREADIATPDSRARVLVVPTAEERLIARDTYALTNG